MSWSESSGSSTGSEVPFSFSGCMVALNTSGRFYPLVSLIPPLPTSSMSTVASSTIASLIYRTLPNKMYTPIRFFLYQQTYTKMYQIQVITIPLPSKYETYILPCHSHLEPAMLMINRCFLCHSQWNFFGVASNGGCYASTCSVVFTAMHLSISYYASLWIFIFFLGIFSTHSFPLSRL